MSKSDRELVRKQLAELNTEHEIKMRSIVTAQKATTEETESNMRRINMEYESAIAELKNMHVNHLLTIDQLKLDENERQAKLDELHRELTNSRRYEIRQDLEKQIAANAFDLSAVQEHQKAEFRKMEELRQQLNEDGIVRATLQIEKTAQAQKRADENGKNRDEMEQSLENRIFSEKFAIKDAMMSNAAAENQRRLDHQKKMQSIECTGMAHRISMDLAAQSMTKNRAAKLVMDDATQEVHKLSMSFGELQRKVKIAYKQKMIEVLKMHSAGITADLSNISECRETLNLLLNTPTILSVDENDEARRAIFQMILDSLPKLAEVDLILTCLKLANDGSTDFKVVETAWEAIGSAEPSVLAIRSMWNQVPPINSSNLVHEQFLRNTNELFSSSGSRQLKY